MSSVQNTIFAVKSCFRCGKEFPGRAGKRVCSGCHEPRRKQHPLANRGLTFRENQIVNLLRQAKPNKQIAYELHLTEGTIKEYLNQLFKKLGARNRTELAIWAVHQIGDCRVTERA